MEPMDCFPDLPYKHEARVLSYLPLIELIKLRTVSKKWQTIIDISIQKREVNLFVETGARPLRWSYNNELIDDHNNLVVKKGFHKNEHFLKFSKSIKRIFIYCPAEIGIDETSKLFQSFPNLEHVQIIADLLSFNEKTYYNKSLPDVYFDIDYKLEKLKTFTYNLFQKQEKSNAPKNFQLNTQQLTYLSIDTCINKDCDSSLFKNLKYLRVQELDLDFQTKTTFDELEVLVCLRPFTILLKNMPKIKQIHFPYFYTDVGKYNHALKELESKLDIKNIIRKDSIEFYFSGFKCRTNDYLNSIFKAYMTNLKPFRFHDSINHEVLKLAAEKCDDLDLSHEAIENIYTDEFGENLVQLDERVMDKLTLNRNRLVRLFNKIENNSNLEKSVRFFYNVEKLLINDSLDQAQMDLLPKVFSNLIHFEQTAKQDKDFKYSYAFLSKMTTLKKFVIQETFIPKDDFKAILFDESRSKFLRFGELLPFVFELLDDGGVQMKFKKMSSKNFHYFYFVHIYSSKKFTTKEEFKSAIDTEIDEYTKRMNNAGALGWADL